MHLRRSAKGGMSACSQGSHFNFSITERMDSARRPFFDLVAELFNGAVTRAMFGWIVRLLLCMLVFVFVGIQLP